ncbi:4'-phosphopantetheinyl transferase family protein [Sinomonas mesophila]|uniref:4'-phosphopantetheinyl transferase family protein n=1 Tax=Sinomonas mesophila TaxID=1531955 RepID=UPI0011155F9E|nr:4'-phosphopantetheinyl transferase superfamily protein [Sinomonas mesophila]
MILRAVPLGGPKSALPAGVCTPGELERARAMLDPRRRHAFLAGRLALRAVVAEALGADPADLRPAYACPECGVGEHGAPGFTLGGGRHDAGARPRVNVAASMSRAGGWALLAAEVGGCDREVGGCDREVRGCDREVGVPTVGVDLAMATDFRHALPHAAFSAAELRLLSGARDRADGAARLWARKEALLKALGTGLRGDPQAADTLDDARITDLDTEALGLPAGFAAAVARVPAGYS